MTIILILSGVIAALIFIIKITFDKISKLKNEIASKDFAIERAAQNLKALTDYERLIQKIRTNHFGFIKRIGKVKENDDEEINNILRDIVTLNNVRVSNRNTSTD